VVTEQVLVLCMQLWTTLIVTTQVRGVHALAEALRRRHGIVG
jgi:hypothetical protein